MPIYRYWPRATGLGASKLTTSTALASLMAQTGYAVRALHEQAGEYTTEGTITPGMLEHDPYPSIRDGVPYLEMDGWVYGLVGDTQINSKQRPVTFSGPAHASLNGMAVEFRLVGDGGEAVTGWVPAGTISSGGWSVTRTVPATNHWCWREVRLAANPGVVARSIGRCAVGFKYMALGPSSLSIAVDLWPNGKGNIYNPSWPLTAADNQMAVCVNNLLTGNGGAGVGPLRYGLVNSADNTRTASDAAQNRAVSGAGVRAAINQLAQFGGYRWCYISVAKSGRSARLIFTVQKEWDDLRTKVDLAGNDVSLCVFNEMTTTLSYRQVMSDGGLSGQLGTLDDILAPGYRIASQNYVRLQFAVPQCTQQAQAMYDLGGTMTPPVVGLTTQGGRGGPHPRHIFDPSAYNYQSGITKGAVHEASVMALGVAKAMGLTSVQYPYYSDVAISPDRMAVTLRVNAANGGAIYSDQPADLHCFRIMTGSTQIPYSAVLSGTSITVTRRDGLPWQNPLTFTGQARSSTAGLSEEEAYVEDEAIADGVVKEAYAPETFSGGLQVAGYRDAEGKWWPHLSLTL